MNANKQELLEFKRALLSLDTVELNDLVTIDVSHGPEMKEGPFTARLTNHESGHSISVHSRLGKSIYHHRYGDMVTFYDDNGYLAMVQIYPRMVIEKEYNKKERRICYGK